MILITGANGQLAKHFLAKIKEPAIGLCSSQLDLTNHKLVAKTLDVLNPSLIINCAAYTKVDEAEDHPEPALAVNVEAVRNLGRESKKRSIRVVHFSTDYIFSGSATPYTESQEGSALNVYGKSKYLGEVALLEETKLATIFRTSWIYSLEGKNFLNTMLSLAKTKPQLHVVFDQIGSPTYAGDLADVVLEVLAKLSITEERVFNYSNEGVASWYDFAKAIFSEWKLPVETLPIRSAQYPMKALRPACAVLDKSLIKKTFDIKIPHWRDTLSKLR
ncbi:MAG: dTDP-4-dehydrorhamnose reductase [Proteobacteria bacterium]|nr:MAG: dTDP-4-dehydrorhamnose reductase [Pseudomonadota bacterium]